MVERSLGAKRSTILSSFFKDHLNVSTIESLWSVPWDATEMKDDSSLPRDNKKSRESGG